MVVTNVEGIVDLKKYLRGKMNQLPALSQVKYHVELQRGYIALTQPYLGCQNSDTFEAP